MVMLGLVVVIGGVMSMPAWVPTPIFVGLLLTISVVVIVTGLWGLAGDILDNYRA